MPPPRRHVAHGLVAALAGCSAVVDDAVEPVGSDASTPSPSDSDPGVGRDTDPVDTDLDVAGLPVLVLHELLTDWCDGATPCRTGWVVPPPPGTTPEGDDATAGWSSATAGRFVAGRDDPWVTVLVDVLRDARGDGTFGQRGLILAYDPATGALVDHPGLPDDFVAAGLIDASTEATRLQAFQFLAVRDLDGRGSTEVLVGRQPGELWRYRPDLGVFEQDRGLADALGAVVQEAVLGRSVRAGDVDGDGLTDLELAVTPRSDAARWRAPLVTALARADGGWELAELYAGPTGGPVRGSSGIGTLWRSPGGDQVRITPDDGAGSCWRTARHGGRVLQDDMGRDLYEGCDIDEGPDGVRSQAALAAPMAVASGFDLDRDGTYELLITTTERALGLLDASGAFVDATFGNLAGLGFALGTNVPDSCANGAEPVPEAGGIGWTCPSSGRRALPWGVRAVDLDDDGWRDLFAAAGEDTEALLACRADPTGAWCIDRYPLLAWRNRGDAGTWVPSVTGTATFPSFEYWPMRHRDGNVAPYGDWNGLVGFDLDDDGDVDWLLSGVRDRGRPAVFRTDTAHGNRGVCLRPHGAVANPEGIGSFVDVTSDGDAGPVSQHAQLGGTGSPNADATPPLCFGVGRADSATVVWRWPSGAVQTLTHVPTSEANTPGAVVDVVEPGWATFHTFDGRVGLGASVRSVAAGEPQVLRLCAPHATQDLASDAPPVMQGGAWEVRATSHAGASVSVSAFRSPVVPTLAGCSDFRLYSGTAGSAVLTVTLDGVDLPWRPRLAWR